MAGTWKDFALPQNFMPAHDSSLQDFLTDNQKFAVRIDAGKLRRVDTMLVELLLCAAQSWRTSGLEFQVTKMSAVNEEVFMHLGITSDLLTRSVAE
jgi:anti-anti-sigma regulatory factor